MSDITHDGADDGFHEIQLSGKQLVFLFMATTCVSVIIFLCGVMVGRDARDRPDRRMRLTRRSRRRHPRRRRHAAAAPTTAQAPAAAQRQQRRPNRHRRPRTTS